VLNQPIEEPLLLAADSWGPPEEGTFSISASWIVRALHEESGSYLELQEPRPGGEKGVDSCMGVREPLQPGEPVGLQELEDLPRRRVALLFGAWMPPAVVPEGNGAETISDTGVHATSDRTPRLPMVDLGPGSPERSMDDVEVDREAGLSPGYPSIHALEIDEVERSALELSLEVRRSALEREGPEPADDLLCRKGNRLRCGHAGDCPRRGAHKRIDKRSGGDPVTSEHLKQLSSVGRQEP
jgi:hypothetical protein